MTTSCPPPSTSERREEQARALCLRLLTARARTRAELARQLTPKEEDVALGDGVVDPDDLPITLES